MSGTRAVAQDLFADIVEKLKRAGEHIAQLETRIDTFLDDAPHRTLVDDDGRAAESFKAFHDNRGIPAPIKILAGEAVYHLRSVLDHLICGLIQIDEGVPSQSSQFPIFRFRPVKRKDQARYERQIAGIHRPAVRALIERSQPYHRGDPNAPHWLADLKTLSNVDKHRTLTLQVVEVLPRTQLTLGEASTEPPATARFYDQPIEIVDMKRELTTQVSFREFRYDGRLVPVIAGLQALHLSTAQLVAQFEHCR